MTSSDRSPVADTEPALDDSSTTPLSAVTRTDPAGLLASSFRHQPHHVGLARRERTERVLAAAADEQLAHHLGVQCRAAGAHPAYGLDEPAFPQTGFAHTVVAGRRPESRWTAPLCRPASTTSSRAERSGRFASLDDVRPEVAPTCPG